MPMLTSSLEPPLRTSTKVSSETRGATSGIASMPSTKATTSRIPRVTLECDTISRLVASQLAISMLGHVLFLKNQIPFPVAQLARLPAGIATGRAAKARAELLASFDTLHSHLLTTFTALSTAFALRCHSGQFYDDDKISLAEGESNDPAQAFLAFVVGPTLSSPKARVLFAVDGLEVKHWGRREDHDPDESDDDSEDGDSSDQNNEDGSDEEDEELVTDGSEEESEIGSEDREGNHADEEDNGSIEEPPPSRTPSPEIELSNISISSASPTQDSTRSPLSAKMLASSAPPTPIPALQLIAKAQSSSPATPPVFPSTTQRQGVSHAEQQQQLRTAERLLARTLATASAGDNCEDMNMACEMAPTQTHVVLRAPRRFSHPAWAPTRQNLSGALDGMLNEFLADSGRTGPKEFGDDPKSRKVRKTKSPVEGIWLSCRSSAAGEQQKNDSLGKADRMENDLDDLIWWSWDCGKLVGFTDW